MSNNLEDALASYVVKVPYRRFFCTWTVVLPQIYLVNKQPRNRIIAERQHFKLINESQQKCCKLSYEKLFYEEITIGASKEIKN